MRERKNIFAVFVGIIVSICGVLSGIVFLNDSSVAAKNIAQSSAVLSLFDFRYKELERDGGVEVLGLLGYHFTDKDEIKNIKIIKKDGSYVNTVSSAKAVKVGDETTLSGGVVYDRSDGYRLIAKTSKYFQKSQMLNVDSNFSFEGAKFIAYGDSSQVDIKNKRVAINSVRAKINY